MEDYKLEYHGQSPYPFDRVLEESRSILRRRLEGGMTMFRLNELRRALDSFGGKSVGMLARSVVRSLLTLQIIEKAPLTKFENLQDNLLENERTQSNPRYLINYDPLPEADTRTDVSCFRDEGFRVSEVAKMLGWTESRVSKNKDLETNGKTGVAKRISSRSILEFCRANGMQFDEDLKVEPSLERLPKTFPVKKSRK